MSDLTKPQEQCLNVLAVYTGPTAGFVAHMRGLGEENGRNVSIPLDRLVSLGMATTYDDERGRRHWAITDKGKTTWRSL